MSELKPCPFCGGEIGFDFEHDNFLCSGCWAIMPYSPNGETANTRPIEDALTARITELEQELNTTDGLLKEATETIGAVIACCTYNSNDDGKIGICGIDQKAFTRIEQFITHYNDAVSAGKVSVDVKRELTDAEIEELGAQEAERKVVNLHKVISKQQLKIQRQAENISTLLHLYTSGERSQAHKRVREKYKTLKKAYRNLREQK